LENVTAVTGGAKHGRILSYTRATMTTGHGQRGVLSAIATEALDQGTPWLLIGLVCTALILRFAPDRSDLRSRMRAVVLLLALNVLLLPATGLGVALEAGVALDLRLTGSIAGALAAAGMAGLVVFGVLLPRLGLQVPRIVQDVIVAGCGTIGVFGTASRAGVNLSGIVATGAVLTAVIGLALQDTLGNVVGGLALQLDSTIQVGDWIRVLDISGRVVEIRWRSTSIETRNWETVVIPNSVLTRSQVVVLGRREGEARLLRRTVGFQVDYRFLPTQVIEIVHKALRAHRIANVATAPEPSCVLMELGDSSAHYAVRYFLTDFANDDGTDGVVRARVYLALTRAKIPLSIPAQTVFVTEDSPERREHKREADLGRRLDALGRIGLFADLSVAERSELAAALHPAPFATGEVITKKGAEAHHLYVIGAGRVSVRAGEGATEYEVAQLGAGDFFGEMSLLTGEKRSATVVALTDVECYRLDADAFRHVLASRHDLAEKVAVQLAERRMGLQSMSQQLNDRKQLVEQAQRDLLQKIRSFFHL
jgi:small-conductance mechanosensitive channel/CRP-like cAMP-binding protein